MNYFLIIIVTNKEQFLSRISVNLYCTWPKLTFKSIFYHKCILVVYIIRSRLAIYDINTISRILMLIVKLAATFSPGSTVYFLLRLFAPSRQWIANWKGESYAYIHQNKDLRVFKDQKVQGRQVQRSLLISIRIYRVSDHQSSIFDIRSFHLHLDSIPILK